jgi:HlyD family secretion protein
LKEKGLTLGLAYRVRVRIYTQEKTDVLKIPRTALFRGTDSQWQVFSVKNGSAALVPVTLGIVNAEEAEIREGLKAGETLIVAPPKGLRNGDQVNPS